MVSTIWKYEIPVDDLVRIRMPQGASILDIQVQGGKPCMWVRVDPAAARVMRKLRIYGTGHPVEGPAWSYVGTFQMHNGALVFHVFDGGEERANG